MCSVVYFSLSRIFNYSVFLSRIPYYVLCILAAPVWWSYDRASYQKLSPDCSSTSLQSATVPRSDYSRTQLSPFGSFTPTWNHQYCTYPETAVSNSVWNNCQVTGHPCYQHYQPHQLHIPAMSHIGLSDCHGVRHVTSSLPVNPGPNAHARLADRSPPFVDSYCYAPYHQADMRTDTAAFPVPVAAFCKSISQHGDVCLSDNAVKQLTYNASLTDKQYNMQPTTTQVIRLYFHYAL